MADDAAAPAPKKAKADALALPSKIKLRAPFGYIDDDGRLHHWMQCAEVTEAAEIADIIGRGFQNFYPVKD